MSGKQKGVTIQVETKVYRRLENQAKKDGLTIAQEVTLAMLYFFRKHEPEIFEEAKRKVDPAVLQALERETA